jgi:hypothetical protein
MVTVTEKHKQFIQGVMFCLSWFVDMIATSSSLGSLRFAMVAGCVCWYILAWLRFNPETGGIGGKATVCVELVGWSGRVLEANVQCI